MRESPPQINMVRVDGASAALTTILKTGSASTLDVINGVKGLLPKLRETLPASLKLDAINDQSSFVNAAVNSVIFEGVVAAALTGLMILIFLSSWRSTLIITISIPLAILASVAALAAIGETINVMTLGGLALAVGILVDDATVTIENINWHLEQGKASKARSWTARARSCFRRPFRCCVSASSSCRCSISAAWRAISSARWLRRSSLP